MSDKFSEVTFGGVKSSPGGEVVRDFHLVHKSSMALKFFVLYNVEIVNYVFVCLPSVFNRCGQSARGG